jgi:hypothetical protein
LSQISRLIYADQDKANRLSITSALIIVKLHNVNCTKEADLIRDPSIYLPYSERYQLVQLLAEFPDITIKAAKDFKNNYTFLKKRVQRAFKKIEPVLNDLAKK